MKKSILFTTLLFGSLFGSSAFADEVNLKKSCVKDYPLVAGETDSSLLTMYAQVCDKKNKDNKNGYLAQAAQRFQQLGKNFKALQLVEELNAQQVQHSSLTDVKFLAGIGIANQALAQIRDKEVRYLSEEGYVPAMALADAVRKAKPLAVIEIQEESKPAVVRQSYKAAYKAPVRSTKTPVRSSTKNPVKAPQKVKSPTTKAPTATPAKSPAKNPFEKL